MMNWMIRVKMNGWVIDWMDDCVSGLVKEWLSQLDEWTFGIKEAFKNSIYNSIERIEWIIIDIITK